MAIFSFSCPEHGVFNKMLPSGVKSHKCPVCGHDSVRLLKVGSVRVTEVIDNGIMSKSIERPANIDELMEERINNQNIKKSGDETV
jgi:hypothetical protein